MSMNGEIGQFAQRGIEEFFNEEEREERERVIKEMSEENQENADEQGTD